MSEPHGTDPDDPADPTDTGGTDAPPSHVGHGDGSAAGAGHATGTGDRGDRVDRAATALLAVAILLGVVAVVYVAVTPGSPGEPFTEFYLLGPDGEASGYPTNLTTGETGEVIVGLNNHEGATTDYRVVVTWNDTRTQRRDLSVPVGESREVRLTLSAPDEPGTYRVRFLLYKLNGSGKVYDFLRLYVTVREPAPRVGAPSVARTRGVSGSGEPRRGKRLRGRATETRSETSPGPGHPV